MGFKSSNYNFRKKRTSLLSDINITPFVDILLVLLIIFMVAAPMMTSGISLDLPKGVASPEEDKNKFITVSINKKGEIFLDDSAVKITNLGSKLLIVTSGNLSQKISLRADISLHYGKVMEVVKIINLAGFNQLSLITELDK